MSEKREQLAFHIRSMLILLGVDADDPLLAKTPSRVADLYLDTLFDGLNPHNAPQITPYVESAHHHEEVTLEAIPFVSLCEHHLVPMIGTVKISFLPSTLLVGFSHFYDLVRYYAHRPQLQERLTRQLVDALIALLQTEDVCVTIKATHFCVLARTEGELASTVETKAARGHYATVVNHTKLLTGTIMSDQ